MRFIDGNKCAKTSGFQRKNAPGREKTDHDMGRSCAAGRNHGIADGHGKVTGNDAVWEAHRTEITQRYAAGHKPSAIAAWLNTPGFVGYGAALNGYIKRFLLNRLRACASREGTRFHTPTPPTHALNRVLPIIAT